MPVRLAGLAGMLAVAVAAGPALADPALFVATDANTTIYLFGTIHVVPCETAPSGEPQCADWRTPAVDAALAAADEVWIETDDVLGGGASLTRAIQDLALFPAGTRLSDYLPAGEIAALAAHISPPALAAVVAAQFETMQPWFVVMTVSLGTMEQLGGSFSAGVDLTIAAEAAAAGKPVFGFESGADSVRLLAEFANEPMDVQVADLRVLARLIERADFNRLLGVIFREMWEYWVAGDLDRLAFLLLADDEALLKEFEDDLPAMLDLTPAEYAALDAELNALYPPGYDDAARLAADHESLVAARNRGWMEEIGDMLDDQGTFFIAVGAGHLTGPDNLPELLEARGVEVRRVQ